MRDLLAAQLEPRQRLRQPRHLGARRAQLAPRGRPAPPAAPRARPAARRAPAPAPRPRPAPAPPRRAARPTSRAQRLAARRDPRRASPRARGARLVVGAVGPQPLQRLAGVLPPLRRLRGRHLQRGQLGDSPTSTSSARATVCSAQLARASLGLLQRRPVVVERRSSRPRAARSLSSRGARQIDASGAASCRPPRLAGAAAPRRAARDPSPGRRAPSRRRAGPADAFLAARAPDRRRPACVATCRASAASTSASSRCHHRLELADLALLLEHAGQRRLARAAGDDALRIDHLALEGDDGLGRCASRARAPARARDPRPPARRRAGTSRPSSYCRS